MGTLFAILLVLGSSYWMGRDAASLGYDKRDIKGLAAVGPGGWAFAGVFMWILAFPLYIAARPMLRDAGNRRRLREQGAGLADELPMNEGISPLAFIGTLVLAGGGMVAVAAIGNGVLGSATPTTSMARAEVTSLQPASPPASPPPPSPADRIRKETTLSGAIAVALPLMDDKANEHSVGTGLLAFWSAGNLKLADVKVAKDETTFALTRKDPDEARGKRLCTTGTLIQIAVEKTPAGKITSGLLQSWSGNIFSFITVGSSGTLVERQRARVCGVVTGLYDYSNSAGGVGHAVEVVGMFDLAATADE